MKRRISFLFRDRRGTTLMESICGLAILAVILVAIYGTFLVANRAFGDGDRAEKNSQEAFAEIELGTASERTYTLTLSLGGHSLRFEGIYQEAGKAEDGTVLHAVNWGEAEDKDFMRNVRETYVYWKTLLAGMTPAERVAAGYPRNSDNTSVRTWLRENVYGGSWPTMPQSFLSKNGLPEGSYYIQPFYEARTGNDDPETNTIIFAKTDQADGWYVGLVYNHEEKVWYHKLRGGYSITNSWETVKAELHSGGWEALTW